MKKQKFVFSLLLILLLLSGCEHLMENFTFENLMKDVFEIKIGNVKEKKDPSIHLFSDFERDKSDKDVKTVEERFNHHIVKYSGMVNKLWETEGFYRKDENSSPQEILIDFYLFMEYHKDTQLRNLQFPDFIQKDLLLIEALFAKKAIDYIETKDLKEYNILRDDLVYLYKEMYREELINILFEGHEQLIIIERIPNIVERTNSRLKSSEVESRLKDQLGIPDTIIARGMGLNLVTLYSEMDYLPEGNTKELAILLTMEMRLSGINMRLERFFHVTNSLEGLGEELADLRKDVEMTNSTGHLKWVRTRMLRSINYLEDVYLFYKGEKKVNGPKDIFIDLQTREDFYALGMLSNHLKEVMDREKYWSEVEKIRIKIVDDGLYEEVQANRK